MSRLKLSDPRARAKVIATLREVKAKEKAFHVIHWGSRWLVLNAGSSRSRKSFQSQDDAVEHARGLARGSKSDLVVHARDGSVRERESFRELSH